MATVTEYEKIHYEKFDDNEIKFDGSEERNMLKFPAYPFDVNYVEIPQDYMEGSKEEIVRLKSFSLKLLSTEYLENWLKTIRDSGETTKIKIKEVIQTIEKTEDTNEETGEIVTTEKILSTVTRWIYDGCFPVYKDIDDKNTWIILKYETKYDSTPAS